MKNYCKYCGQQIEDGAEHKCSKISLGYFITRISPFIYKLLGRMGIDTPKTGDFDYYERGRSIVPDCINPDNGEKAIKQYDIAILRSRAKLTRAEGRMQLTNKRLIFRANGFSPAGKVTFQQEFAIDKIDGVEIRKDYRFRGWDLLISYFLSAIFVTVGVVGIGRMFRGNGSLLFGIFTTLLSLACCIPFFAVKKRFLMKQILSGIGFGIAATGVMANVGEGYGILNIFFCLVVFMIHIISVFLFCFKPNLRIEIKTSGGTPAMELRHKYTSLLLWHRMDEYSGFAEILPGKDADTAIKEIGSLIDGLKSRGDANISENNNEWED